MKLDHIELKRFIISPAKWMKRYRTPDVMADASENAVPEAAE